MSCMCKAGAGCVVCQPPEVWDSPAWPQLVKNRQLDELEDVIMQCKCSYYCKGEPLVKDATYDAYEDALRAQRPDSYVLSVVGCGLCYKEVKDE